MEAGDGEGCPLCMLCTPTNTCPRVLTMSSEDGNQEGPLMRPASSAASTAPQQAGPEQNAAPSRGDCGLRGGDRERPAGEPWGGRGWDAPTGSGKRSPRCWVWTKGRKLRYSLSWCRPPSRQVGFAPHEALSSPAPARWTGASFSPSETPAEASLHPDLVNLLWDECGCSRQRL